MTNISWRWVKGMNELEIIQEKSLNVWGNRYETHTNKICIPREQAILMIQELHDDIEFQEYYDAHLETVGG